MGFCERLTALLKEKKIDKNDFLSDCGLGRNSFSNWKNSKKGYPTAPVLKVISDYLGVSVEYLIGETDERGQKKSPAQMDGAGKAKRNLLSVVADLSEDECTHVLNLIDAAKKL